MIQVRDLRKSFGPVTAVQGLSFDAPDGTITGLLGPNGAGKTTTLKILAGVIHPDAGMMRIGDTCQHRGGREIRRHLGVFLDHHGLYGRLTAREHIAYFGRLRGLPAGGLNGRVEQVLSTLGLSALADRRVGAFSQGERMKVSLGCAIIHAPGHLLLDEPTNGLDVPTVLTLRIFLKECRDRGNCIVISSHVLSEIEELCDRVVMVAQGRVVAEGTLDEVRGRNRRLEDAFITLTGTEASRC